MTEFGGTVGGVAPSSFPAFARVLHRIDPTGRAIRWSQVCASTGAVAHPLMQWHLINTGWAGHDIGPGQGRSGAVDPQEGDLDAMSMAALYEILWSAKIDGDVLHAFWIGWGGMHPGATGSLSESGSIDAPAFHLPFPPTVVDGPLLELPGREYLVFAGNLDPGQFAGSGDSFLWPQSPSLSWPADHTWCVATEIDFDFDFDLTVVAGSAELIAAVLAHPDLEAWRIAASSSLLAGLGRRFAAIRRGPDQRRLVITTTVPALVGRLESHR